MINPVRTSAISVLAPLFVILLLATLLAACSPQSPNIGKYYKGRILHISVAALERTDELRWTTSTRYPQQGVVDEQFYRIAPESDANELVILRVKVENHTATSALVNIDPEAAQLRDFLQGRYQPIDVNARAELVGVPESPTDRCNFPVNPEAHDICVRFLWNLSYVEPQADGPAATVYRAQELPNGTGLDGWLVFEIPKGTPIRSFRWSSGDTVTIDF